MDIDGLIPWITLMEVQMVINALFFNFTKEYLPIIISPAFIRLLSGCLVLCLVFAFFFSYWF